MMNSPCASLVRNSFSESVMVAPRSTPTTENVSGPSTAPAGGGGDSAALLSSDVGASVVTVVVSVVGELASTESGLWMTNAYTAARANASGRAATAPANPITSLRLSTGTRGSVPAGGSTAGGSGGVDVVASAYGTVSAGGSCGASDVQSRSGTFVVGSSISGSGGGG